MLDAIGVLKQKWFEGLWDLFFCNDWVKAQVRYTLSVSAIPNTRFFTRSIRVDTRMDYTTQGRRFGWGKNTVTYGEKKNTLRSSLIRWPWHRKSVDINTPDPATGYFTGLVIAEKTAMENSAMFFFLSFKYLQTAVRKGKKKGPDYWFYLALSLVLWCLSLLTIDLT